MIINNAYLKVKNISSIKDLEDINKDFVEKLSIEKRIELVDVIKKKESFEKQVKNEFLKRFAYDRTSQSLYLYDFAFWYIWTSKELLYHFFIERKKELPFVKSALTDYIAKLNFEFYNWILWTSVLNSYESMLDIFNKELNSLQNYEEKILERKIIPNHDWVKLWKEHFGAEIIDTLKEVEFESMIVHNDIFEDKDKTFSNWIVLYSTVKKELIFIMWNAITMKDIDFIWLYRKMFFERFWISNVKVLILNNNEEYNRYSEKVMKLIQNSIRKIKKLKDRGLYLWLINSIHDRDVWDYSFFINKRATYQKTETLYKDLNKSVLKLNDTTIDVLNSDLQEVCWIKVEWEITESSFNIGRVSFRISINNTEASYTISIRRTSNTMYSIEEITQNGIETKGAIWNIPDNDTFTHENKLGVVDYVLLNSAKDWVVVKQFTLEDFLSNDDVIMVKKESLKTSGIVFVIWETGSWKSTYLKALYSHVYQYFLWSWENRKIVMLESPVEENIENFYQLEFKSWGLKDMVNKVLKRINPKVSIIWEARDNDDYQEVITLAWLSQTATTMHKKGVVETLLYFISNKFVESSQEILDKMNMLIFLKGEKIFNIIDLVKEHPELKSDIKMKSKTELLSMFHTLFNWTDISKSEIQEWLDRANLKPIDWNKSKIDDYVQDFSKSKKLYELVYYSDIKKLVDRYKNSIWMLWENEKNLLMNGIYDIWDIAWFEKSIDYQYVKLFLNWNLNEVATNSSLPTSLEKIWTFKPEYKQKIWELLKKDFPLVKEKKVS